jgi:glutamine amidotransferase PdxT
VIVVANPMAGEIDKIDQTLLIMITRNQFTRRRESIRKIMEKKKLKMPITRVKEETITEIERKIKKLTTISISMDQDQNTKELKSLQTLKFQQYYLKIKERNNQKKLISIRK